MYRPWGLWWTPFSDKRSVNPMTRKGTEPVIRFRPFFVHFISSFPSEKAHIVLLTFFPPPSYAKGFSVGYGTLFGWL